MSKTTFWLTAGASLMALTSNVHAIAVPEIDGGGAAIGIGLAIGLVALIRERRQPK